MTARRSEEDFGLPLLEPDADLEHGMDTNAGYESLPEGSHHSSEGPEWLSEPHGPLRDSSAPLSGPERAAYVKLSRSVKRSTAAARARRLPWICLDEEGRRTLMHADKRAVIAKTGLHIPIRDMRLLDFNLVSVDSTILVRDNAIIASMDHVRFIVTADRVIIPRDGTEHNPLTARFVDMLEESIVEWARQRREFQRSLTEGEGLGNQVKMAIQQLDIDREKDSRGGSKFDQEFDDASSVNTMRHALQPLPFELVVLEAALKEVVASMASQIKELEGVALPALDTLTRSVNTSNLERVRKVKTRHQRLSLRAEALRDELQRFLQDDDDMARMCLSRRKELEDAARAVTVSAPSGVGGTTTEPRPIGENYTPPAPMIAPGSLVRRSSLAFARQSIVHSVGGSPPQQLSPFQSHELPGPTTTTAAVAAVEEELDAEAQQEVENLLESYYMQVDGLFDKLVSIGEYVKDTEEYINIELDSSRNRLIRMEIVLSVATFAIMPFNLLAGILGENLIIPEQITGSVNQFYGVNIVAGTICLSVFYVIILYMRYTKLI